MRFFAAWKKVGLWLANAVALVLFAIIYALMFVPLAIAVKLSGKHFLPRFTGDEESYFLKREPIENSLKAMKRQW